VACDRSVFLDGVTSHRVYGGDAVLAFADACGWLSRGAWNMDSAAEQPVSGDPVGSGPRLKRRMKRAE
jgi:hypothetical protein